MRTGMPLLAGLAWSAVFILLESTQSVFFGTVLQKMDSFLLGFWVFGITILVLSLGIRVFDPDQFGLCGRNLKGLFACNCSTAAGWVLYLFAIQLIEPAVAFTVSSAVMPVSAIVFTRLGIGEPANLKRTREKIGFCLAGATLLGFSGFVRGSTHASALLGLVCLILSGSAFALMLIHCRKLDFSGLGPATVFAFRFPVYILLAAAGWFLQLDYKGPVVAGEVATAILIGFAIMAFSLYAMQKAVSGVGVLLLSNITALGPLVVFCLQMIEGWVAFSGFTLAGLLVYILGALLAVSSLVVGIGTMRREIVLPTRPTAGQKKTDPRVVPP